MQCRFCQAETPDNSIRCPMCGARLREGAADSRRRTSEPMPAGAPDRRRYFEERRKSAAVTRAIERLGAEMAEKGAAHRFLLLREHLTGAEPVLAYAEIAQAWGMKEASVRVFVHRLRQRFALLIREELQRSGLPR